MSWHKILRHDMTGGLLRKRYLAVFLLTLLPFFEYRALLKALQLRGTVLDFLFYIFKGQAYLRPADLAGMLPLSWLLTMGSCLFLNLDYVWGDLSLTGQQILVRCGSRRRWFLSKCLWSGASTCLYLLLILFSGSLLVLLTGGSLSLSPTPALLERMLMVPDGLSLSTGKSLILTLLLPLLSLASLNLLQMTLCLFTKSAVSFLMTLGLLFLSVYFQSPLLPGNSAMVIRSQLVTARGIGVLSGLLFPCILILLCVLLGTWRFGHMDILPSEESQ